jgi:hypothetical protein
VSVQLLAVSWVDYLDWLCSLEQLYSPSGGVAADNRKKRRVNSGFNATQAK